MTDGADRVFSLAGPTVVAISFANNEKAQAERLGATKFIDKMELANELIPTLLQFAPSK